MQLQYDEAYKQVSRLQLQLATIEKQMDPTQAELDKDRLLLIQEKDQLLRELRGVNSKGRPEQEKEEIQARIHQLESDLTQAMQISNKQIAQRSVHHTLGVRRFHAFDTTLQVKTE
jgi:protein KIBRA